MHARAVGGRNAQTPSSTRVYPSELGRARIAQMLSRPAPAIGAAAPPRVPSVSRLRPFRFLAPCPRRAPSRVPAPGLNKMRYHA